MSTDQFNFVGLTRSPVKRTPQTGYYDGEGHRTYTKGEPVSAATTERMSIGSVNSAGSTDPRRRRALHPVPANALETSHTPSSVALLLSSISSKRAALSVRRSTLPVPRTLHLSPAEATRPDPTMMSERTDRASRCSGSSSSQQHYLRDDAERHHSPPSSTRAPLFPETSSPITPSPQQQQHLQNQQQHQEQQQQRHQHHQHQLQHQQQQQHQQHQQSWSSKPSHDGSPSGTRTPSSTPSPYTSGYGPNHGYTGGSSSAGRHHQPATPAVADPYPTPSRASHAERSYDAHDDDGGGEWSSDCSFTNGAVFSPDPTSLSVVPVHRSGGVSGGDGGVGGGGGGGSSSSGWRSSRRGDNDERSVMVSPISNIYSASKVRVGGSALRGIGEATPRCPETRGASPFPEATVNRFGESSTRTPASGSGSAFLRVGGTRSPVVPESVAASSSSASRYAARGGATPATAGSRSSSNASRYAARDRATPAAEEHREDELLPDTPAAAATLAGMMMGGGGDVADSLCETVDEERSFQEEEEEEEGGFLAEGPSGGSADAQVGAGSTTPESPLNASTVSLSRSAMTPRRPRSAMALLDISAETPRRMIRGILGGSSLAGMSWKQQRPQQEPRFVPKVSKVTETEIVEDDTPRRFILGMLANSEKKVDGVRGLSEGRTCPPNGALVGTSVRYNSSSSAAAAATTTAPTAAAARAAAAATAAVSSPVASPSSAVAAAAAVAVLPRTGERGERAVQDDVTTVRSTGGTAVLQTIAIQTSSAVVPVNTAPRAAALPRDVMVVGPESVSGGGKGRQIIKAGVGLAAVVGFCVIVVGVVVLACLVFSKPALAVPIY